MPPGILFLCGSVEIGKDGVGDYTRRLATELRLLGQRVSIVATHDKVVRQIEVQEQSDRGMVVPILRIPFGASSADRISALQSRIEEFNPDWISLQYVPFSFNSFGIPLNFIRNLSKLSFDGLWQIMFHELWSGAFRLTSARRVIMAVLQKGSVKWLIHTLKPALIHTHLPEHYNRLRSLSYTPRPLPLFSNIHRVGSRTPRKRDASEFRAIFFSQMSLPPAVADFLRDLQQWVVEERSEKFRIDLLGGNRAKGEAAAEAIRAVVPAAEVNARGFLEPEELSAYMNAADLAITPVPLHAIGKSGTIAAFLAHQLPVAAPFIAKEMDGLFQVEYQRAVLSRFSPESLALAGEAAKQLDGLAMTAESTAKQLVADMSEVTDGNRISSLQNV